MTPNTGFVRRAARHASPIRESGVRTMAFCPSQAVNASPFEGERVTWTMFAT
jgi:hypothetical protein